jgi:hypothetical protein
MDTIFNLLKNKQDVIKFLLDTIDSNTKASQGIRKLKQNNNEQFKTEKLLEVVANQSIQVKHLTLLLLCYVQGSNFDVDVAQMLNKMGRGEEALKQMMKNKFGNLI